MDYPHDGIENTPKSQTQERSSSQRKSSPLKPGKLIKVILAIAILLFAFMGLAACSDRSEADTDTSSRYDDIDEEDLEQEDNEAVENTEENTSDENNSEEMTLDELTALVQQSQSATVELVRDPNSRQSLNTDADEAIAMFKAQDFEKFKEDFVSANFQPVDYPFYFLPEYRLTFDTGVSYTIMQDQEGDNRISVLQFDGNSSLWCAPKEVYLRTNIITTTLMDDFSNMHIFCTADDEETAMNNVLHDGLVWSFIYQYYHSIGYEFEGEGFYNVDDLIIGQMPETAPNLYWALIQYSVKPSLEGTLPDNMNIYKEDGWIKGGFMLAAIWNDTSSAGVRSYLLGITPFEYDVNGTSEAEAALELYEQSYAKNLAQ